MLHSQDVERGDDYQPFDPDAEREALLASPTKREDINQLVPTKRWRRLASGCMSYALAFVGGVLACLLVQVAVRGSNCISPHDSAPHVIAPPHVGSTEKHHYPPMSPTNVFPSLFPSNVGYAGGTPTGAEPALLITAPSYPVHTGAAQLVAPPRKGNGEGSYDLFKKWGNLSPWYSVDRTAFGLDSGPEPPETCRITALHLLHRHGARYPTAHCEFKNS